MRSGPYIGYLHMLRQLFKSVSICSEEVEAKHEKTGTRNFGKKTVNFLSQIFILLGIKIDQ